eukprot:8865532-Pyramimonas_sp.AAC.1
MGCAQRHDGKIKGCLLGGATMWCELRGVTSSVQPTWCVWCQLGGTSNVVHVQATGCKPCGVR